MQASWNTKEAIAAARPYPHQSPRTKCAVP
jgi:hypothetical protein